MLFKKYKTFILATALVLSLTAVAFADGIATPGATDDLDSKITDLDEVEEVEAETLDVLNVIFPTDIPFVIDPYGIREKGQIYSELYQITNQGNNIVTVTINSFYYEFANDKDFISFDAPFDEDDVAEGIKAIYMAASLSNQDSLYVLSDQKKDADISFTLKPSESETFDFSGMVSSNLSEKNMWKNGDVKITMSFIVSEELEDPTAVGIRERSEEPSEDTAENILEEIPAEPPEAVEADQAKTESSSEPEATEETPVESDDPEQEPTAHPSENTGENIDDG